MDLNRVYGPENALWEVDGEPAGFEWIDVDNALENIVAFVRRSQKRDREIVCVCNFSALPRNGYRLGLPREGTYRVVINTDAESYGGGGSLSIDCLQTEQIVAHSQHYSAIIDLPALSTMWLLPQRNTKNTSAKRRAKTSKK